MQKIKNNYDAVVIGVSAGGIGTIPKVVKGLDSTFPLPIMLVQHTDPGNNFAFYIEFLKSVCSLQIKTADEKEKMMPGTLYIAPANYHLLVEEDLSLSLNIDDKVSYCRPSIDVLFESAADVFKSKLIGIILTGGNCDGLNGMKAIMKYKGMAIVQEPSDAEVDIMPRCVINEKAYHKICTTADINKFLKSIYSLHS